MVMPLFHLLRLQDGCHLTCLYSCDVIQLVVLVSWECHVFQNHAYGLRKIGNPTSCVSLDQILRIAGRVSFDPLPLHLRCTGSEGVVLPHQALASSKHGCSSTQRRSEVKSVRPQRLNRRMPSHLGYYVLRTFPTVGLGDWA